MHPLDAGCHGTFPSWKAGHSNGTADIFVRRIGGPAIVVSLHKTGAATGNSFSDAPAISGDGKTSTFQSFASDIAPVDTNNPAEPIHNG